MPVKLIQISIASIAPKSNFQSPFCRLRLYKLFCAWSTCKLLLVVLNMENHSVPTSNTLFETLGDNIPITFTLNTSTKDIGIENQNKDSAPTTPYQCITARSSM